MNSKNVNSIYDMSKKIEEDSQFEKEARSIVNAYRKVEQLKVTQPLPKQQIKKPKNQSTYAMKIKQTLKQINANKAKEMETIAKYIQERAPIIPNNLFSKLQKAGASKLFNTLQEYNLRMLGISYRQLIKYWREQQQKQRILIQKFKLFKLLRAWRSQAGIQKAERLRQEQKQVSIDVKSLQLAKQFRIFYLLKKSFKFWQQQTRRQIRRRQYENKIISQQIKAQQVEQKPNKNKVVEQNSQLQNKVRGFLDGLKQKVAQNDRLKTIKEKTEESKANQQHKEAIGEISNEIMSNNELQQQDQGERITQEQVIIRPPLPQEEKKPMTNDDLQKKRKQLESKHKNRKEALQKLRRQKEQKKKQEERQRNEIEKQIDAQQKRIKQEKYRQYLKSKNEQAEFEKRERQLIVIADEFNSKRLKKYYGWLPWASIKTRTKQNIAILHQTLVLIIYRVKGDAFMRNLAEICEQKVERQMTRMKTRYCQSLLRKGIRAMRSNASDEKQQKQIYEIMHNVNTLKIMFNAWKRVRHVIASQNYDWLHPRYKRAEEFSKLQLKYKTIRSLAMNKQESRREKCIEEQKHKIKNKIKVMLEQNDSFDYQQYL